MIKLNSKSRPILFLIVFAYQYAAYISLLIYRVKW